MTKHCIEYPQIFRVRQHFDAPRVDDASSAVESQLAHLALGERIKPGQSVAIAVGSRGIASIREIIKAIVDHVKALGAEPFLVPAMGSHGGGTATGQQKIIESYGITEAYCGCQIQATMETVVVCRSTEGFPVHFDKFAFAADHVIVTNRIKPHTQFSGDIESGVLKMLLIGLGKHEGAKIYHRAIKDYSFAQIVRSVAKEVLAKCPITAGIGIVENCYGQTARIEAIAPAQFEEREKALLVMARELMPRLPFEQANILLIDEIGKNISGTGFDVTVTGRKYIDHAAAADEFPKINILALRDLTELSGGNGEGMGLAEFCRTRLLDKVDMNITRVNAFTSGHYTGSMIPLNFDTDREMLQVMLRQIGLTEPPDAKLMWIHNTKSLTEVECGAAWYEEAARRDDLEILTDCRPLPFDVDGNLPDDQFNGH